MPKAMVPVKFQIKWQTSQTSESLLSPKHLFLRQCSAQGKGQAAGKIMQGILGKGWEAASREEVVKGSVAAGSPLLFFVTALMWHPCCVLEADFSLLFQSTGHSRFKVLRRLLWLVQVLYACVLTAVECQKVRVLSWSVLGMGERMFDLDLLTMRGQYLREEIVSYTEIHL